jgi:hypothetical protein
MAGYRTSNILVFTMFRSPIISTLIRKLVLNVTIENDDLSSYNEVERKDVGSHVN